MDKRDLYGGSSHFDTCAVAARPSGTIPVLLAGQRIPRYGHHQDHRHYHDDHHHDDHHRYHHHHTRSVEAMVEPGLVIKPLRTVAELTWR